MHFSAMSFRLKDKQVTNKQIEMKTLHAPFGGNTSGATTYLWQECFLQKEARECVMDAFVIEDSKFKWCFVFVFFFVEDVQVTEEADMLMWV